MKNSRIALAAICFAAMTPTASAETWTLSTLHNDCSRVQCKDGEQAGPLLRHSDGVFYGVMVSSGDFTGTVFELTYDPSKSKWRYRVIHKFCSCDDGGVNPVSNLIEDVNGNLYGVTNERGPRGAGTVYELVPDASRQNWSFQLLYAFPGFDSDGRLPLAGLTYAGASAGAPYDGTSSLFGMTYSGGVQQTYGVAYSLTPAAGSWNESVLYDFCSQKKCADGLNPEAGLVMDSGGNLFGVTRVGGNRKDGGVVFEISPASGGWTHTLLHTFCSVGKCQDGSSPSNGLLIDASGNLFGTTYGGGTGKSHGGGGTLFELSRDGTDWNFTQLHTFCRLAHCRDGSGPRSNLVFDPAGNIYGLTYEGGPRNQGTAFRWDGMDLTTLYGFCSLAHCKDGADPRSVTWDPVGNLLGTTNLGGSERLGTIFELSPPAGR